MPQVDIGGKSIEGAPCLKWYQWVVAGLPLPLVFQGGALGALIGVGGVAWRARLFRSGLPGPVSYLASLGVALLAFSVWLVLGSIFGVLLRSLLTERGS